MLETVHVFSLIREEKSQATKKVIQTQQVRYRGLNKLPIKKLSFHHIHDKPRHQEGSY